MEKKVDLRIKKTHKALLQALQELLCEKSFDEISVSELCDRAEIRRATFYKHFADKSELLAYMIQQLQQDYNNKNEISFDTQNPGTYLINIFTYFIDFLEENKTMVSTILHSNARHIVLDILSDQIEFDLKIHFRTAYKDDPSLELSPEIIAVLYSGAMIRCVQWWITKDSHISKEELIQQFKLLMKKL